MWNGELDQKKHDLATHYFLLRSISLHSPIITLALAVNHLQGTGNVVEGRSIGECQAFDRLLPIGLGGTSEEKVKTMLETTVDYWTCIDLAEALEQTMRNDLWPTAERIAETASRITDKPEELVAALSKFNIRKAALDAATGVSDTTITTLSSDSTHFSKAG